MSAQQTAGILLIAGFILVLAASFIGPPRLYQEPDSEAQLKIIADHTSRWIAANLVFGLAGITSAAGLLLVSIQLREVVSLGLTGSATAAYSLGTLAWVFFVYRRTVAPASLFTSYAFSPLTVFMLGMLVLGLLLFGVALLQAGYPGWLGVGIIAGMVVIGAAALVFPARFFQAFPPQVLYFFTLVTGIVLMRR